MSLSALFYVNGTLEGMTALIALKYPHVFTKGHKLNHQGKMYARRFGMLLGAFSIGSILIARQPDSATKHIFSLGWLLFHSATAIDRALRDRKLSAVLIHSTLATAFMYYIYQSDIKFKKTLMIWRIKDIPTV
eukprot:339365_1